MSARYCTETTIKRTGRRLSDLISLLRLFEKYAYSAVFKLRHRISKKLNVGRFIVGLVCQLVFLSVCEKFSYMYYVSHNLEMVCVRNKHKVIQNVILNPSPYPPQFVYPHTAICRIFMIQKVVIRTFLVKESACASVFLTVCLF